MFKTFKNAISVILTIAFVASLMPVVALAEVNEVTIGVQNYGTCHVASPDKASMLVSQTGTYRVCTARNESSKRAYSYGQFDLTGYEEILTNDSTEVTYSLELGGDYSSSKCSNLTVQLFNDDCDYVDSAITYNEAASLGLHGNGAYVLFAQEAGVEEQGISTVEVDKEALASVLQSGTDNSIVCYAASTKTSAPVYFKPGTAGTGLTIKYDTDEIDTQEYVDTISAGFDWSEFSTQRIDAVYENITLPSVYRGASVIWSSSNENVISNEGVVTPQTLPETVILTAELTYGGITNEEAIGFAEFEVTVVGEEVQSVTIPVSNPKHSRSKNKNSAQNPEDQSGSKITFASKGGGDNDRYTYGQFDLTGYEAILAAPNTKATYSLYCGAGYSSNKAYNFKVQLFNDESDYDPETITYAIAEKLGLHGDGIATIFERTETEGVRGVSSSAEVDTELLSNVLLSGTGDSIITYAISTTNSASSTFLPGAKGTGLTLEYFASEADNQSYVSDLAEGLEWSYLSADSIDAVENDLPTLYGGAEITWSANEEGVITPDGKITCAPQAKKLTLTAELNYNGVVGVEASAEKTFDVTIAAEKPVIVKIPFENVAYSRSSATGYEAKSHAYGPYGWGSTKAVITGGVYRSYAQLDFSGYEEILANPSTIVNFKAMVGGQYSSGKFNDLKFVVVPDSTENYDPETITWNEAVKRGYHKDSGVADSSYPVLFAKSDGTVIEYGTVWPSATEYPDGLPADKDVLTAALGESNTNSKITLFLAPISNTSTIRTNVEPTGFYISYYESEIDNAAYMADVEKNFTWENISTDDMNYVENKLPTYFKGATLTWSSNTEDVIASDGTLIKIKDIDRDVVITATADFNGETFTKDFNVTIAGEKIQSVVIPLSEGTYITKDAPSSAQGVYDSSYYSRYMYPAGLYGGGNDRVVFLKWDFAEHLDKLAVAKGISMKLKSVAKNTQAGTGTRLSVLPESYESWTEADLTYDSAAQTGLYTAPSIFEVTCAPLTPEIELTSSAEFLDAIKKSVADNPSNGTVNFRWEALSHSVTTYRLSSNKKENFTITLYYYESDVVSGDEFVKANAENMPWSFVSGQAIDKVASDLTLPETFYGAPVTWASSDEAVITSSGEVFATNADANVKLTATVGGVSKEFDVTVSGKNFVVGNDVSASSTPGDIHLYNYTNTHIYANKDAGVIPTLVIATYRNGDLLDITVKENYEIKKGVNYIYSSAHKANANNAEIKVFFMGELSNLTPMYDVNNK